MTADKTKTRIYVSGPMTGLTDYNLPAFAEAAERLNAVGYDAVDPGRHGADEVGMTYEDYLRRALEDLLTCDAVAVLPGWMQSKGAWIEVSVARALSMPVQSVDEWAFPAPTSAGDR